ncbi:AP2-like ethylene-responsive transcription factor At1g79700 [Papaver somniferum]|uniref:AP2-like ethylene-responsive transcription factor At1g79700 n=1 Tax=Papaver somniferum TaxID=3469 RepID=UPI000E6F542A|nr:AP2-like ethylene-responsive transcription factor At1g79700 [Papaver somniferum]
MAKLSQQIKNNNSTTSNNTSTAVTVTTTAATKVKRKRKSVPRDSPPQRSSIYRGVTRHRWTGRYEAHLWDKNSWNESQNKKGRQVYLGAYDGEEAAAHAYDLAALKYWGRETILNFPLATYEEEIKEMEGQSKEEYIGSLRRRSSGFSRGVSKYRGVARHHHNGRWEARIGRVFGNKYLYLGTYATQEEAATAYDMAAIEYRGLNAVTNFDLSRYIKWLRPNNNNSSDTNTDTKPVVVHPSTQDELMNSSTQQHSPSEVAAVYQPRQNGASSAKSSSALGLLLQSSKFKEMLERTSSEESTEECPLTPAESDPPKCSFPDDIQTFFECQDSGSYVEGEDNIFGDLNSSSFSPIFDCELGA